MGLTPSRKVFLQSHLSIGCACSQKINNFVLFVFYHVLRILLRIKYTYLNRNLSNGWLKSSMSLLLAVPDQMGLNVAVLTDGMALVDEFFTKSASKRLDDFLTPYRAPEDLFRERETCRTHILDCFCQYGS